MDYAAKDALAKIIDDSALAYRVIAERMGGVVSHVRVGYIHNGEKFTPEEAQYAIDNLNK